MTQQVLSGPEFSCLIIPEMRTGANDNNSGATKQKTLIKKKEKLRNLRTPFISPKSLSKEKVDESKRIWIQLPYIEDINHQTMIRIPPR